MRYILSMLFVLLAFPAGANNPLVPEDCSSGSTLCTRTTIEPYPETGVWYDSDQPGSGFVFEVQRGTLVGYYFGYGTGGEPVWYLMSGTLELVEKDGIVWSLEADLLRYEGGNCIACSYVKPEEPAKAGEIKVYFMTRNLARFSINGGSPQRIQSFTYGSVTEDVFPSADYRLPRLDGPWVLYYIDRQTELDNGGLSSAGVEAFDVLLVAVGGTSDGEIRYVISNAYGPYETLPAGTLLCSTQNDGTGGTCKIDSASIPSGGKVFYLEPSDISDSYFSATAEDGDTLQGFRINYD